MFKSILLPIDGSALSMGTAIQGIALAGSTGAAVHKTCVDVNADQRNRSIAFHYAQ